MAEDSYRYGATIETAMARGGDNFSLIRHCLAAAVVVSHAFSVGTGIGADEPLHATTGFSLGEHAVNGFFAVSGFLVTMSFMRRGPLDYVVARALRIAPALVAAVLLCAFVMGPLLTQLSPGDYFRDPMLWRFVQATLTTLKSTAPLPGVFEDNPFRFALGTVWTLKYEIACYVLVLAIGMAGVLRRRTLVLAGVIALAAASLLLDFLYPEAGKGQQTAIRLPLIFMTGSLLFLYRDRVRLGLLLLAVLAFAMWLAAGTPLYRTLLFVTQAYGVLWFALAVPPLLRRPPRADLSYGLYLYGWPVQQVLFGFFPQIAAWAMIGPALVLSALVAALSWYLVEQPALAFKGRLMLTARRSSAAA
ncbi:peptidoglycan/LPS O-acetylase OafA/YrhL [Pseudochelatococcus lubricantis]|uniref:Peptidoglycan/LPS O-acetylase OafA/YrhL n=1 Tax=Pseudochelatococcus lubricantis TaxID=1538102 RepID=A0ABX0UZL0_9HYPH|nr:acyltransferase [Pseudochelatococcus lubricantis]NIJ56316.1 peptidoglycan/LPS O-acetylase OafA/YrhL [Pseudochelatococcus lubricantis]